MRPARRGILRPTRRAGKARRDADAAGRRERNHDRMKLGLFRVSAICSLRRCSLPAARRNHAHKGAVLDPQLASSIQPGVDNKASVAKLLGTPTLRRRVHAERLVLCVARHQPARLPQSARRRADGPACPLRPGAAMSPRSQRTGKELVLELDPTQPPDADAGPQEELLRGAVRQYRHGRQRRACRAPTTGRRLLTPPLPPSAPFRLSASP